MVATAAPSHLTTAGIATRGIALAVDAAIANVIFLLVLIITILQLKVFRQSEAD